MNNYNYFTVKQEIEKERERNHAIMLQKIENDKIERGILNEAMRWLNEYDNTPEHIIDGKSYKNYIFSMQPFIKSIIIYNNDTAKYKDCDIRSLVVEEFEKLRSLS